MTTRFLLPALLVFALAAAPALAQQRDGSLPRLSPNAQVGITLGVTDVVVHYGAPAVRDREVFGSLVPYDQVWRTGANEATTLTVSTDVRIEGQDLPAGTYGVFSIPGEQSWTFIFNGTSEQWGAYQYDEARDVLRVEVPVREAAFTETMTFTFEDFALGGATDAASLVLRWADVAVPVRIESDTDDHLAAHAEAALAEGDWRRTFAAARYVLSTRRGMDRALPWAAAAAEGEPSYATLSLLARYHAAAGDMAAAQEAGTRAVSLTETMETAPRDLDAFRAELETWHSEQP